MAKRSKTPSYVLELELIVSPHERKVLNKRFEAGRQVYNACLGEALKRLHKIQRDRMYREILAQRKALGDADDAKSSKQRKELAKQLSSIEQSYGYTEFAMHKWVVPCGHHFSDHLGSLEVQAIASRAFKAVEKLHYHEAKKVHFKAPGEMVTIENKNNKTGLRWKDGLVCWGKLNLCVKVKKGDVYAQKALADRTKFIRISKREIRGKERFFVQLIQEGHPPSKNRTVGTDTVGLDIGPATVAVASSNQVSLRELAPNAVVDEKKLRKLNRAMDRSRRATNPQNYNSNGVPKKGCHWYCSRRYVKTRAKKRDLQRKMAAKRKQSHEILANEVLAAGNDVRVETMRFQALQKKAKKTTRNKKNGKINAKKRFGKSIGNHAPALFLSILERKLTCVGGRLCRVNTHLLKASQFNHITEEYRKKPLGERWGVVGGHKIQRDLYSAFLIRNTNPDLSSVHIPQCHETWDNFVLLHDNEILRVKTVNTKNLRWYVA